MLISIAPDSVNHLVKFSEENAFPFQIISDRGAKIAKLFNVYTFGSAFDISFLKKKLAIPSDFLINKQGIIVWRYISAGADRPTIKDLVRAIDQNK